MKRLVNLGIVAAALLAVSSCAGAPPSANGSLQQSASHSTAHSTPAPTPPPTASSPSTTQPTAVQPSVTAAVEPKPDAVPASTVEPTTTAATATEEAPPGPAPAVPEPLQNLNLNSRGNVPQTVGQEATFGDASGEKFADLQAVRIKRNFTCTSDGALHSINGEFVALDITISVHSDFVDSGWPRLDISNTDFKAWDSNGNQVSDPVGNSATCVSADKLLPSIIEPGTSASGYIILDLPTNAESASFAIGGFEGSYGWEWSW